MTTRPFSAVWSLATDSAWSVAETPLEVRDLILEALEAGRPFVELTLADDGEDDNRWVGRPLLLAPAAITAISPPLAVDAE